MSVMVYTPIDELPMPPKFMLDELEEYEKYDAVMNEINEKVKINLTRVHYNIYDNRHIGSSIKKYSTFGTPHYYIHTSGNEYKKFIAVNLPINKNHLKSADNDRFYSRNEYTDRRSLKKAELYEWCKMNNLPVKKSTKLTDMVDILRKM